MDIFNETVTLATICWIWLGWFVGSVVVKIFKKQAEESRWLSVTCSKCDTSLAFKMEPAIDQPEFFELVARAGWKSFDRKLLCPRCANKTKPIIRTGDGF